ncbi:hypothetical protein GQX73_g1877 [Xylaria multiplex]|uniref:Rhodopsin domain-containing protein n=1 Tax=Xylaria multiplex TaxID=323545 RepID=A0A7C8IW05_9PEZI|nr:hypothetical protein GQX73_g1877 [Xylaria multiplex]
MMSSGAAERVNYATTALTLFILMARIVLWLWRRERIDTSFTLAGVSIVVVVARIITNVYYLQYGNAADVIKHVDYFDENNLDTVRIGSILVLVARALVTVIIWLQVCILLIFYSRITYGVNWVAVVVKITWATVAVTFFTIIPLTFLECRPISLYWQITPDPGTCVQAYAQLLTQTISNIVLDIMLIVIAYPIVNLRKRTIAEHVTLWTLFVLGTFCIIISIIRLVTVHYSGSAQITRSLWASVQMLVSTFVANAPNIYGSIRAVRMKKSTGNSTPAPTGYGLSTIKNNRARPATDSWMKMDDYDYVAMTPNRQSYIRPLPPATTFYDDETAPAPYSHQSPPEEEILPRDKHGGPNITTTSSSESQSSEIRPY